MNFIYLIYVNKKDLALNDMWGTENTFVRFLDFSCDRSWNSSLGI